MICKPDNTIDNFIDGNTTALMVTTTLRQNKSVSLK